MRTRFGELDGALRNHARLALDDTVGGAVELLPRANVATTRLVSASVTGTYVRAFVAPCRRSSLMCQEIMLSSGLADEAYRRYGLRANRAGTYLAMFRPWLAKYPHNRPARSCTIWCGRHPATTPNGSPQPNRRTRRGDWR